MNTTTANSKIVNCTSCGEPFGASSPAAGAQALLTQCGWCDRRYYISVLEQPSADIILSQDACKGFLPQLHLTIRSTSSMERLLVTLPGAAIENDARRQFTRVRAALRLVVAPLDSKFQPLAPALDAASIDISANGISFVLKSNLQANSWMIDFGPTGQSGTQAIMKVVRREAIGEGCWKIAGPFAMELEQAALAS